MGKVNFFLEHIDSREKAVLLKAHQLSVKISVVPWTAAELKSPSQLQLVKEEQLIYSKL